MLGIGGTGVKPADVGTLGMKHFAAGQLFNSPVSVTAVQLK